MILSAWVLPSRGPHPILGAVLAFHTCFLEDPCVPSKGVPEGSLIGRPRAEHHTAARLTLGRLPDSEPRLCFRKRGSGGVWGWSA